VRQGLTHPATDGLDGVDGVAARLDWLGPGGEPLLHERRWMGAATLPGLPALVAESVPVTCVFAVNDVMAVGAMSAFREAGVRVPDDLSIVGFDDIDTLRDVAPRLSSVRLPLVSMGREATRLALSAVQGPPRLVEVHGEILLRESGVRLVHAARRLGPHVPQHLLQALGEVPRLSAPVAEQPHARPGGLGQLPPRGGSGRAGAHRRPAPASAPGG